MSAAAVPLGELMPAKKCSVDPRKHPDEEFELFSIPAFDAGAPETVGGSAVGSSKQVLERHDVLLSKIVPHIRRSWVVEPRSERRMIGSSEWIVFRSDRFAPNYLRHVLTSDRFHQAFMRTVAGVGGSLLRARPSYVAEIEIPLPPVTEQRRMAALLDAADALRGKRRQALFKLEDLINAVFVDMFSKNASKVSWFETTLGEIAEVVSGATPSTSVQRYWDGRVRWATPKDLSDLKGPYISTTSRTLSAEGLQSCSASLLPSESVLLSSRAPIGHVAINKVPMATNQGFKSLIPDESRVDPRFLYAWLRRHRPRLESLGSGATFKEVSKRVVEGIDVSLPPITLQRRFGDVLDAVEAMRIRLCDMLVELDALCTSLQQRAFRGEL